MRRAVIALAAVIAAAVPASASGGLWCDAEDQSLKFEASTGVTRGTGAFFQFKGMLEVKLDGVPEDLRNLPLDGMLIHSWLDADEAKLQFYFERRDGEFASVDLTVETERVEEGEYRGEYPSRSSSRGRANRNSPHGRCKERSPAARSEVTRVRRR